MRRCYEVALFAAIGIGFGTASADERVLDGRLHHLRAGSEPEWSEFPRQSEGPSLRIGFTAKRNGTEATLRLRQQDVKQVWAVRLNGTILGQLRQDENDMVVYLVVPAGSLALDNVLSIEQANQTADDIRVGEIAVDDRPLDVVLSEASVDLTVHEASQAGNAAPVPCRITAVDSRGALRTLGANSNDHQAVRPGILYSATGQARIGLPAGEYTLYAGRGMEYSVDSVRVTLKPGDAIQKRLVIRREVPTDGYVSCDPHVHTLTYSGHGDATVDERVITIAGEGIELPIATEHNRQVDYGAVARRLGVRRYFTPVVGNEVTTGVGHFNVFPVRVDAAIPEFQSKEGHSILDSIAKTGAKVVILNHPRDLHGGFRPFGPERHNPATGENTAEWLLRVNAMEVVNSGAQQTDVLQLYQDWFALLNRGVSLTPVGASDSHDVGRYVVGQARTYVRCKDDDPADINVTNAVDSFLEGRVSVACGLFVDLTVNDRYGPGDLVPSSDMVHVKMRVFGPGWTIADKITLYANGVKIREAEIADGKRTGLKWEETWNLPRFKHDFHLAAIATGPAVSELYWPIAKPYQPMSPTVRRQAIGSTGVVWIDNDGNGKRTSALEYAKRLKRTAGGDSTQFVLSLAGYDEAVAVQAAGLLAAPGISAVEVSLRDVAKKTGPHVEHGFRAFVKAWRETQFAQSRLP